MNRNDALKLCLAISKMKQARPSTPEWMRCCLRSIDAMTLIDSTMHTLVITDDPRPEDVKEADYREKAEYLELMLAGLQTFTEAHRKKYGEESMGKLWE